MRRLLTQAFNDDRGATAIEYGLIAAMVAIVAIVALSAFGDAGSGVFNRAMNTISEAVGGGGGGGEGD